MRRSATCSGPAILLAAVLGLAPPDPAPAAEGVTATRDGVTAWVPRERTLDGIESLDKGTWEIVPAGQLPRIVTGYPVLVGKCLAAGLSGGGELWVSTRRDGRLTRRGSMRLDAKRAPVELKLAALGKQPGLAVEAYSEDGSLRYSVGLRADGILEIKSPSDQSLIVHGAMRRVLLPSLVGADLLYIPNFRPQLTTYHLPATNMLVGLMGKGDCVMVAVCAPGRDGDSLGAELSSFSVSAGGETLYLTYVEHPGLWHEEPLQAGYLEKDTPIAWKRPFDAKWIGRFHVESDRYDFPFYFRHEKAKLWGRYIRGWFGYPFWFDGEKTMVHFEKKFPPKGDLLIYCLEGTEGKTPVASPVGVAEAVLGKDAARKLLDFDGVEQRLLLKHGNAVCAMTRKIEEAVAAHQEVKKKAEVAAFADDVAAFIRLIRERVFEFRDFAAKTKTLLAAQTDSGAAMGDDWKPIEELLDEIVDRAKEELPKATLEEVRQWTDQIKAVTAEVRPDNLAKVKKLGQQCRSVAGTQDDLDRELSVLTIRVMQQAAAAGTASPRHARLAGQVIADCRAVLRRPTWWEPARLYVPKSDPGIPP
jgi:hypothetical protein